MVSLYKWYVYNSRRSEIISYSFGDYIYTLTGYGGSWSLVSSDGTELANNGAYSDVDSFAGCLADD